MEPTLHSATSPIVSEIAELLMSRGWTLSTAESCTGGGIGHALTVLPGSSAWFEGGVICYANGVKANLLHVPTVLLNKYGAVSEQVAIAMARGVRKLLATDISIAVTGVAGPGGGDTGKTCGNRLDCLGYRPGNRCKVLPF
ncbi:CinA family protein [Endozoicomonas sp. GU-1]|uniref:CinA family protein n=1 Tax=Endozoicomonas sp. GU-1 TaxID=3009078 RepID=UPI0022B3F9AC|nr:nicotinamide-nucleotide amidohydrolase family protein [Endozoicomonas sp. GU-1]WBA87275.1 nicotinamide-nucleotide amidohydrolase family protein [Endozoicomonas sp. GU-1]